MDTAAEFRKYAANCNKTAKVSKDPEAKATWRRMEERCFVRQIGGRRRAISSAPSSKQSELEATH
jgi:hypothetical protein